jgi:hypothetical protein
MLQVAVVGIFQSLLELCHGVTRGIDTEMQTESIQLQRTTCFTIGCMRNNMLLIMNAPLLSDHFVPVP